MSETFDVPQSRIESLLQNILGAQNELQEPFSRNEKLLLEILNEMDNDPFIVTLTPTAQDFSGVMDKTPAEIRTAYDAGKQIRAVIPDMNASFAFTQELLIGDDSIHCVAGIFYGITGVAEHCLIRIDTAEDSSAATYSTIIYPLTPLDI
jgi:hypothetical protein